MMNATKQELLALAEQNGLRLQTEQVEMNESGMDFLVAFATDADGQAWVLRKPRREDVWERAENEHKVLNVVRPYLSVHVPDWRIFTPELIAYPLLSGDPVATIDPTGYTWRYEQDTLAEVFFKSLAQSLAELHSVNANAAAQAGLRVKNPAEARQAFASNIEEVQQHFAIPARLSERWQAWLHTDSYWPEHSALHHGDLHPPHIIVDDAHRVTGLIDWTEAEVADPSKDFVLYYALFGMEGLQHLLKCYEQAGGRTWPRVQEHIIEQWAAYPAQVAKFALVSDTEENWEMARSMIANWNVEG